VDPPIAVVSALVIQKATVTSGTLTTARRRVAVPLSHRARSVVIGTVFQAKENARLELDHTFLAKSCDDRYSPCRAGNPVADRGRVKPIAKPLHRKE
jgi:hypothetical protein